MGWWENASRDERLAQVKAGAELGMTWKQVAMNCRTTQAKVQHFAHYYGIKRRRTRLHGRHGTTNIIIAALRRRGHSEEHIIEHLRSAGVSI